MARYRTAPSPTYVVPGVGSSSAGARQRAPSTSANTSFRFASITGTTRGPAAASASSVYTPATGIESEKERPRAAARPILIPVMLPGPVPTTTRASSDGTAPCSRSSSSASASSRPGVETRSPSTPVSPTRATVVTEVAVSNASVSIGVNDVDQRLVVARDDDQSTVAIDVPQTHLRGCRRKRSRSGLGPFDEADRAVEVRLEIAPLSGRNAGKAVEVEVADVDGAAVAVPDGERRARHALRDPKSACGAADERGLPDTELARDEDDVADAEHAGDASCHCRGLVRSRRRQLEFHGATLARVAGR